MNERRDPAREAALRSYFGADADPGGGTGLRPLVVGAVLLLIGISIWSSPGSMAGGCAGFFLVPGLLIGLWGLAKLLRRQSRRRSRLQAAAAGPEDAEAQVWLDQGLERVRARALDELEILDENLKSDLLTILAPVLWGVKGIPEEDLILRTGADGQVRFGVYRVVIIALTEWIMGIFICEYDFIADEVHNAMTREYHYKDIVSVATGEARSSLVLASGEEVTSVRELRISLPNNESFKFTVEVPKIRRMTGLGSLPASGAESVVRTIRAMLRDKKNGARAAESDLEN